MFRCGHCKEIEKNLKVASVHLSNKKSKVIELVATYKYR